MAAGKSALQCALGQGPDIPLLKLCGNSATPAIEINGRWSVRQLHSLHASILCPDAETVALTNKPTIVAATEGSLGAFFQVPEYMLMSLDTKEGDDGDSYHRSLLETRQFADRIGYPVLVKGATQGAMVCRSWFHLRAVVSTQSWVQRGGFIQRLMRGWEKCIAFAAFEGRLLGNYPNNACFLIKFVSYHLFCFMVPIIGACMMIKGSYTAEGKVWSGDIEPVPTELLSALDTFVGEHNWTGGGEIEFIEELAHSAAKMTYTGPGRVQEPDNTPKRFLARSAAPRGSTAGPALSHCLSHHGGVEGALPANLQKTHRWVVDFNPRFPAWIFASAYSGCNLPALLLEAAVHEASSHERLDNFSGGSTDASSPTACSSVNTPLPRGPPVPRRMSFVRSMIEIPIVHALHYRQLPSTTGSDSITKRSAKAQHREGSFSFDVLPQHVVQSLLESKPEDSTSVQLADAAAQALISDTRRLTDATSLLMRSGAVECTPRYIFSSATFCDTLHRMKQLFAEVAKVTDVSVQLCLSVKTQPHTALMCAAAQAGYLAECIDLAEVYHAVVDGGFPFNRVVLTGPGKWWDTKSSAARAEELHRWDDMQSPRSPFAWPNRKFHAIFADSLADLQDIVQRLLDPNNDLETEVVGVRWTPLWGTSSRFGLNSKDVKIVSRAADLLRQLPDSCRVGMHFHHAASVLGGEKWFGLAQAFSVFCAEFSLLCGRPLATVDFGGGFEPYFLESAHAQQQLRDLLICVQGTCGAMNKSKHASAPCVQFELGKSISEPAGGVLTRVLAIRERESASSETTSSTRSLAVVVDTTIADLSTPNSHPVFWLKSDPTTAPATAPATATATEEELQWVPLAGGSTEIWGRTCMEWDRVYGSFTLPSEVKVGDFLLVSGCGAYDMSMQYGFGDGVGRTENVLVV